jgi:hypothetical protein
LSGAGKHPRAHLQTRLRARALLSFILVLICWPMAARPRQAADPTQLALDSATLPNAAPRHEYRYQFTAHGGIPPYKYTLSQGSLPAGVRLASDGLLSGAPPSTGQFRFTVAVTDSSNPPQKTDRAFVLKVVPPLLMQWKRYARAAGNRIDGSVIVSNSTENDFDLTFVVLAVADNGRATAIGYQRFMLKRGVDSLEVPFGETLPRGNYEFHVDAVAEVPDKDQVYRVRLQTKEKLAIALGP